jgi:hypothetical protein
MSDPTPPPLSGIARRKRKDAGIPRRSTLDAMYDTFADLTPAQQRGVLEILGVIHRQSARSELTTKIEVKE